MSLNKLKLPSPIKNWSLYIEYFIISVWFFIFKFIGILLSIISYILNIWDVPFGDIRLKIIDSSSFFNFFNEGDISITWILTFIFKF